MILPPNPLVSIALCTYNGERFLSKQMDSILSQTYREIEIVAVDDCSTDNTLKLLQSYAEKDKRVRPYKNDHNWGHTLNFEKAIHLCKGDYIALSDQDDIWVADKIETLMQSVNGAVLVYHDSDFIDDGDKPLGDSSMATKHPMYDGESCLPVILANSIHGHALLFDAKLRTYFSEFDKDFSHDWAIAFVAFNLGEVRFVNKVLVHYRQHQNSITDYLERRKDGVKIKKPGGLERLGVGAKWLRYCLSFGYKKEPELVNKACALFLELTEGKSRFSNFIFMIKYFDLLFYSIDHKRRSFLSKVNFARKLCYA